MITENPFSLYYDSIVHDCHEYLSNQTVGANSLNIKLISEYMIKIILKEEIYNRSVLNSLVRDIDLNEDTIGVMFSIKALLEFEEDEFLL